VSLAEGPRAVGGCAASHRPRRAPARQQAAQPSLGLRGKRASGPVRPSKPERRRVAAELVRQHYEHKKDAECDRRRREEIRGDELLRMIVEKCSPRLRGWPALAFRVLFVFVVLAHERRRVLHFSVTEAPSAAWAGQQIVNAFPLETPPKYLLRDREGTYGTEFNKRVTGLGIEEKPTAPRAVAESIRRKTDRDHPPGVSGSGDRHLSTTPSERSERLLRLLPPYSSP